MSRNAKFTDRQIATAKALLEQANTADDIRVAQAVLLPAIHGLTMKDAGMAMGVSRATVGRLQQQIRKAKGKLGTAGRTTLGEGRGWGGRRTSHMTPEEEAEFLAPWAVEAETAGMIVMGPIRAALAQKIGKPVRASVVWRLLARHGWRKVAPGTRNPIMRSKPLGKKTQENTGFRHQETQHRKSSGAFDLPGRSPFRTYGKGAAVLGSRSMPTSHAQWLRTPVYLRVWCGQSARWQVRVDACR